MVNDHQALADARDGGRRDDRSPRDPRAPRPAGRALAPGCAGAGPAGPGRLGARPSRLAVVGDGRRHARRGLAGQRPRPLPPHDDGPPGGARRGVPRGPAGHGDGSSPARRLVARGPGSGPRCSPPPRWRRRWPSTSHRGRARPEGPSRHGASSSWAWGSCSVRSAQASWRSLTSVAWPGPVGAFAAGVVHLQVIAVAVGLAATSFVLRWSRWSTVTDGVGLLPGGAGRRGGRPVRLGQPGRVGRGPWVTAPGDRPSTAAEAEPTSAEEVTV